MQDDPMELAEWLEDEPGMDPWAMQKVGTRSVTTQSPLEKYSMISSLRILPSSLSPADRRALAFDGLCGLCQAPLPEPPVHCPNASSGEHSWAAHVRAIQDIPQDAATIPTIFCAVLSSENKCVRHPIRF